MAVLLYIVILLLAEVYSSPLWQRHQDRSGLTILQTSISGYRKSEGLSFGQCLQINDLNNPTTIEPLPRGNFIVNLFANHRCSLTDSLESVSLDGFYNTEVVVNDNKLPICSFRLNGITSPRGQVVVTFNPTFGGSRKFVTDGSSCIDLCSRRNDLRKPAFSDYADVIMTNYYNGSASSGKITIYSKTDCRDRIHANVGSGSLQGITMNQRQATVKSFQVSWNR